MTRLKSILQVKLSMTMKEKLRQIKSAICVNRRIIKKTADTRMEAVARADNPYSLIATVYLEGAISQLKQVRWYTL